jgi:hypothetical protein
MEVVALIRREYTSTSRRKKMSDRFLEEGIDITFCGKLGKNTSGISVMLFETYQMFWTGINRSK